MSAPDKFRVWCAGAGKGGHFFELDNPGLLPPGKIDVSGLRCPVCKMVGNCNMREYEP